MAAAAAAAAATVVVVDVDEHFPVLKQHSVDEVGLAPSRTGQAFRVKLRCHQGL